jgi:YebC/PmpR family DNA-binding regulatory protein
MSGHSHYATIKRQKEAKDSAKGRIFSRHAKAIALAIKAGGSADPELNSKLRFAIEQAKADNLPKANIERILQRSQEMGDLEEVVYEGYGPLGVGVVVDAVTNNRNRTSQEIKNIFERAGGRLAGPGSVSYNFELKGMFTVKKKDDVESQMLNLIDLGVEDVFEAEDGIEIYVAPEQFQETRNKLLEKGFEIISSELTKRPKNYLIVENENDAKRIMSFLDALEEHDDVQGVYSNFDFSLQN